MNRNDIQVVLLTCIRDVQELSGKKPPELTPETCPFFDLEGFDSLTAVETTELLSRRLQKRIRCSSGDVNLFISKDGRRALKLSEVMDRIEALIER